MSSCWRDSTTSRRSVRGFRTLLGWWRVACPPRYLSPPSRISCTSSAAPSRMARTSSRAPSKCPLTSSSVSSPKSSPLNSSARLEVSKASCCASIRRATARRKRSNSCSLISPPTLVRLHDTYFQFLTFLRPFSSARKEPLGDSKPLVGRYSSSLTYTDLLLGEEYVALP